MPEIAAAPTPPPAPSAGVLYPAGTLQYTAAGLRRVFAWLLAGEVVFTLIDQLEPKVLPILLKVHGATDQQIAIIVGSINAVMQLLIMPPLGYVSDRTRTRWGRRIPYIFWVTPFATLFLAVTPFAPEIARWALGEDGVGAWLRGLSIPPVVLCFGALVVAYRAVQTATNCMFFGLLRDVIPDTHMGRFLALFRVVGAASTFIITYWLIGRTATHSREIFIGIAALNLVGFLAICWFVREGEYPAVPDKVAPARSGLGGVPGLRATWNFLAESFSEPVYLWTYFVRTCNYAALALSSFIIFFPQQELGLGLDRVGKHLSWPSVVWVVIAYPVGRLVDAWGSIRVLHHGLILITAGYVASFFLVVGDTTFFFSALVTGVGFWIVMLAQLKLAQEIYHPARYSQLAGANTIVISVVVALVVSPAAGWVLDALKGWHPTMALPGVGPIELGPYRLVNLMLGGLYGLAWLGLLRVQHHWRRHQVAGRYVAPL
ncbi:MAG TPA: MFS transporter [Opitutaceae bacterium]|nr:MFS transporter [Opitutaceae bacterium]